MSDEPSISVSRWGAVLCFPADGPPCAECGCSESRRPLDHASGCSLGPTDQERDVLVRAAAVDEFWEAT